MSSWLNTIVCENYTSLTELSWHPCWKSTNIKYEGLFLCLFYTIDQYSQYDSTTLITVA